ncbi:2TM domain-containing protein [Confluentibacter sediminis]|uniref:2TM domain-containing protein n=1 Tax=Confluentibacter sediminis TaxID=2219045 RepID=UPI000DADD90E|nr:2TM domain-containing protein [Confluentibacter sediminis]
MENDFQNNERLERATKRVKRIKGFYTHALVYLAINAAILIINTRTYGLENGIFQWYYLSTPVFWGIGLLAHGLSVFLPTIIMGKDWEERKINKLMREDNEKKLWD